jgi:death-on-curing protein
LPITTRRRASGASDSRLTREPADEPIYLELADALELYAAIIGGTVEQAGDHLRSRSGLESALARPKTRAHYEDADLAMQAAVLAHGIAESQAFVDGNKRLALVAMLTFLEVNGHRVAAPDPDLAEWIISFGEGTGPERVAELIRERLKPAA